MKPERLTIQIDVSRMDLIPAETLMKGLMRVLARVGVPSRCILELWNDEEAKP